MGECGTAVAGVGVASYNPMEAMVRRAAPPATPETTAVKAEESVPLMPADAVVKVEERVPTMPGGVVVKLGRESPPILEDASVAKDVAAQRTMGVDNDDSGTDGEPSSQARAQTDGDCHVRAT